MTKKILLCKELQKLLRQEHGEWNIEWHPFVGWYAVPDSSRCFGDEGEFLGRNFSEAIVALKRLF